MFLGEAMRSRCLWVTAGLQLLQILFFQTAAALVFAALNSRGVNLARVLLWALRAGTAFYGIVSPLREEKGTFLDLVKTAVMGICEPVLVSACKHRLWKQHILGNRGVELCVSAFHCSFNMYTRKTRLQLGSFSLGFLFLIQRLLVQFQIWPQS